MMLRRLILMIALFGVFACSKEAEQPDLALKQTSFDKLEAFESDDMLQAYSAFMKSCAALAKTNGEFLSPAAEIKISRADYLKTCQKAEKIMPSGFRNFVKDNFTPYLVTYKGESAGKFTAYYEAEINASYTRDETYKYPVYGTPYDLVEIDLKDFDETLPARRLVGKVKDGKLVPYDTRAEIARNGASAPVILWGDSDVDIYVMQIQGSAVAKLKDGERIRIAFAQSNGRPFRGIGSILLSKGLVEAGKASMGSIKKWLKDNPGLAAENMNENQRYIFHRLGNPEGPVGAQGVPLTAKRSLAVDKSFVPLGALLWLETTYPNGAPLDRLVVAQDIGSAIKGAVRGDFFYGSGGDEVLEEAGKMNAAGKYYVLIPNKAETTNDKTNE